MNNLIEVTDVAEMIVNELNDWFVEKYEVWEQE